MPGGGAEIFSSRLAKALRFTGKADGDRWCEIHGIAHCARHPDQRAPCSTATSRPPPSGSITCCRLRAQQDAVRRLLDLHRAALPGRGDEPRAARQRLGRRSLRTIAAARLLLDNFPHVEAYWVLLGEDTASIALHFGADDVNGTLEDERVQHMARRQTPAGLARAQLLRIIRDAGEIPVERDALQRACASGIARVAA